MLSEESGARRLELVKDRSLREKSQDVLLSPKVGKLSPGFILAYTWDPSNPSGESTQTENDPQWNKEPELTSYYTHTCLTFSGNLEELASSSSSSLGLVLPNLTLAGLEYEVFFSSYSNQEYEVFFSSYLNREYKVFFSFTLSSPTPPSRQSTVKRATMGKVFIGILIFAIFFLSFSLHRLYFQESLRHFVQNCIAPTNPKQPVTTPPLETSPPKTELQAQVDAIFDKIEELIPKPTYTHISQTSNGKNSKTSIVNPRGVYCVGEDFVVQVDMYDHAGNKKSYGGDFLRPRLISPNLGAAVSGVVEDFKNGSYHVRFPLYWAGTVNINILLFYPSEGVAAVWRSRHSSQGVIGFQGKFEKSGKTAAATCGFKLPEADGKEICEYKDTLYEEVFECYKVEGFPCESLDEMRGYDLFATYLTPVEKQIFQSSNIVIEIPQSFPSVTVTQCNTSVTLPPKPKCQTGMSSPYPSGYFYGNTWNPVYCSMTAYKTPEMYSNCLQGKDLFLIGDSTLRQFMMHFTEGIKIVKYFRYHYSGWAGWSLALEALNMDKDIYVSYKRHGFPLEHDEFYYFKGDLYTSQQIDLTPGGKNTIFAITMGQHFRQFPLKIFIRRAINIRRALERLFLRSPDTKVIIKTENTRELYAPVERQGDFHGYTQYLVLREVFQGLNVGFVDAWDMTVASGTASVHPPSYTFEGILSLTFSFAC
ncbi:NXPE family member 4-like [Dendropsophus ebraccatus]|uniref:NXPE family member 4-like n=1 Tax=Dendropsophus ebraccatus TaxID=150705 RepID=UPI00383118B7